MKGRFLCLKCVQGFRDVGAVFWEGGAVKSTEHRQMNVLLEPSRTNKPAGFYLCCCLLVQSTKWHHCVTGSITHMLKWHNQHLHLEKLLHSLCHCDSEWGSECVRDTDWMCSCINFYLGYNPSVCPSGGPRLFLTTAALTEGSRGVHRSVQRYNLSTWTWLCPGPPLSRTCLEHLHREGHVQRGCELSSGAFPRFFEFDDERFQSEGGRPWRHVVSFPTKEGESLLLCLAFPRLFARSCAVSAQH